MASNPAPGNAQAWTFPTPNLRDILFYEERDARVPENDAERREFVYGRPHPNHQRYPNHKLVLIELIKSREFGGNNIQRWWYAANRESQDLYNYEITYPYGGRKEFPRVTRTYVLPRAGFDPRQIGDADPVLGADYMLVGHGLKRIDQEQLDSLYVIYQAVYDRLPKAADITANKTNYGIDVEYECYATYPVVKWTFDVANDYTPPAYGTAITLPDFVIATVVTPAGLQLVDVQFKRMSDVHRAVTLIYEVVPGRTVENERRDPEYGQVIQTTRKVDLNSVTLPVIGTEITSGVFIVGAELKELNCRFANEIIEKAALPTTLISEPRDDSTFCTVTSWRQIGLKASLTRPVQGAAYQGGVVISSRIQDIQGGILARLIVETATVPSTAQTSYRTDPETNGIVSVVRQVVASSSVPTAPTAGNEVEQRTIGCGLANRVTQSITTPSSREECASIDFTFPAILSSLNFATYTRTDDREYFSIHPVIRASFRKKVKARILVDYHTTQPECSEVYNLLPTNISYRGVLFSLNTGPVLNNAFAVAANTSSGNPDWGVGVETLTVGASSPTATAYIAAIGTEVLIAEEVERWGFNLYRRVRTYINLL